MAHSYTQGDEPIPGSGYRLESFLGRGGFGEVWKAIAPGGAEAALKIIRLGGLEGRKEFRALQLVKKIRHPNLVPIFAFWLKDKDGLILDDAATLQETMPVDQSQPPQMRATMVAPPDLGRPQAAELIVAMGLCDVSLFDRLEQCRAEGLDGIPPAELFRYMEDVAEAIDFLNSPIHEMGSGPAAIQHCDIKPHNLMTVGGAAQICDFGLARMLGADRATTAASTIAYAAPECLQTGQPSASTDQYSLAISYYELRTGVLPYQNETLAAVMAAKEQEKLDFSRLPESEQAVLRRATLRDPAKRYPSVVALVEALHAAAAGTRPEGSRRSARPARRLTVPLILVVLLGGMAYGGWWLWNKRIEHTPGVEVKQETRRNGSSSTTPTSAPKVTPTPIPPPEPPGTERADALVEQGDWTGAAAAYTAVIDGNGPADVKAKAYFGRGRCQLNENRLGAAISDFEAAIRLDPDHAQDYKGRKEYVQAYLDRGLRHLQNKQYERALPDLQRAREVAPNDARAASALGQALLDTKEYVKAVEQFSAALAIRQTAEDLTNRARAYLQLDRRKEARADLDGALQLDEGNVPARFLRANELLAGKDYAAAAADFEKVIALDPQGDLGKESPQKCAEAFLQLGTASLKTSAFDAAIADFDKAAKYDPGNALIFVRRAGARIGKHEYPKAVADLSTSLKLKDNDADRLTRGMLYQELGKTDEAMADFSAAISLNPQNAAALANRGIAYMAKYGESGAAADLNRAGADLDRAVEICRKTPDASYRLEDALLFRAACHRMEGKPKSAAKDYTEVLQLDPKNAKLHARLDELAADFSRQGKPAEAAEWEAKAVELAPDEQTKAEYRSRLEKYQAAAKSDQ